MPYEVEAFGKIIEVPDDVSHADAYKQIMASRNKLDPNYKPDNATNPGGARSFIENNFLGFSTKEKPSIADQAEASADEGANTAAPQVKGAPVRQSFYNKALLDNTVGALVTERFSKPDREGVMARIRNAADEDIKGQIQQREIEGLRTDDPTEEQPSGISGLVGNIATGAKQTGRMAAATINAFVNDNKEVERIAKESGESSLENTPIEQKALLNDLKKINREQGVIGQISDTLSVAAKNKMGTGQMVAEQLPNTAISLAGGFAGFKAGGAAGAVLGPVGATIGATLGFVSGMFLGNVLLEAGGKAIEKASDEDGFTPQDRDSALREGAIKAGVITGVDAATFKLGGMLARKIGSSAINAGARAEAKVLIDAGIDVTSLSAINAALKSSPQLFKTAKVAGERAALNALSTGRKAAILGTGAALETVGEFTGEAGGEYAATGKADYVDATIEALSSATMSVAETAYNYNKVASGNDLSPEGIQKAVNSINDAETKENIDKIKKAKNIDEAINAANESVSQKPVDKDDVLRVADPTLADIERLTGLKPSESIQEAERQQSILSQAQQENNAIQSNIEGKNNRKQKTPRDTEIVLPDNKTLNAQWDIVDADNVKASLKNGESQPRDRTRAASDLQIQSIAKNPDYRRLSDSPVMDIGAPVLSNDGQIVGGNGRFEAISRAYDQGTHKDYLERLKQDAINKGIDPAILDTMRKPVLVRRISEPFDTRQLAIASNSGMSAQYSDLEQAKIDSDRLAGLEDILTTNNGDIALTADNIRRIRDALGNYSAAEIAPFVDANGQLSQQGMKRIRNAMLAKAYGDNQVIQGLIESNDSDIRNILGALTRVVGDAVKSQSTAPKESDVTPSILEAINIYNQLKQKNQPVSNYLKQQDAFSGNVSPAVENILMFLDKNARSQPKLTEFFRDAYTKLGSIDTKTPDIFGEQVKPKPEDLFKKPTIESQLEKHLKKNGYEFDVNSVTEREFNALSESKKAQKELAEKQAKIFGKKIVFVKTKGKFGINGVMVPAIKDTIFIDINTPKPFHAVMAHELSHWMEQEHPSVYKDMLGSLKDVIVNEEGYRKKYGITEQDEGLIQKEIAADLMGDNFTDETFWNKVAAANPDKWKEIAKRIIQWLKNTILKAKSRGMGSEDWVTDAKKAQDIIANAVAQYTKQQDAVGKDIKFHKAFHGSPHDHNKFDSSKIGTGEGAQAYGYGHYFADSKEVAEYYKETTSTIRLTGVDGKKYGASQGDAEDTARGLLHTFSQDRKTFDAYLDGGKTYMGKIARDIKNGIIKSAPGKLYEVELAPKQDEYLLWDKPLSEQSDKVKSAISNLSDSKSWNYLVDQQLGGNVYDQATGRDLYKAIQKTELTDKAASEYLHSLGIRGIKYLDGTSRAKGEGAYNYVVFDDKDIEIKAKFSRANEDYRMEHQSPGREGNAPLSDLTGDGNIYPEDVYSNKAVQYYGTGDNVMDKQSFTKAKSYRGKPDAIVEVYRAVPKGVSDTINPGDWVTINRNYAKEHGESYFDGNYDILSKKVKAGDIFTNGDSIHEWGYEPEDGVKFSKQKTPPDTINIDGTERPTRNSEGKLIHPTEEGIRNFWKWFQNSEVTDKQGRPKVVYHGTDKEFQVFDKSISDGLWFTDNKESLFNDEAGASGSGIIIEAYLKAENLLLNGPNSDIEDISEDGYDGVENRYDYGIDYAVINPNQIKSAIGNTGEFSENNNDIRFSQEKPFNPNEDIPETKAQKAQRIGQDKFNRFKVIKEWLAKEKGINLSESADVYGAEERYYGKVANQQEDFREKVRNPLIEKISKAGYKLDDVEQYLLNRHAQEANAQNRKLTGEEDSTAYGISDADAQAYLDKAPKELAKLADEVQSLTDKAQQLRLDNGIETDERVNAMKSAYQYYVPVRGDAESQQKQNQYKGTGKGFSMKYKPKRRLGHELRNESVIENIFQDYERAVIQVEKNRVFKSLALMAAEIQMPELISIDQPVKRKVLRTDTAFTVEHDGQIRGVFNTMPEAQMFKKVLEGGLFEGKPSSNIKINKTQDQRLIYSASPMLADNEVVGYMSGHEIRLQINDELLARAYKNMGTEALGNILSTGRAINGWMSKAYTGYNPEFILTNLIRDFTSGIINLTGEQGLLMAAKAVANYPKSFASLLKYAFNGKSDKWIDAYRDNGGNTGAAYLPDLERLGEEVKREYASYQGVIANLKEGDSANALRAAGRKAFNATLKYINHLNSAGENAFRLATFKAMVESGKSVNEAASMAKNVTVNFNRKGEMGSELNALYLFFNASLQGTAATSHALFKGRHKYQAWGLSGAMMAVGYMMASMLGGFDDEDKYDEISDATKSRNLIMSYGDGYVKIPVPYGYGYFYNAGRMYAEAQRKGELGKMPYQLMALATEEFSPFNVASTEDSEFSSRKVFYGFLPTTLKIPAEITNNYSSFANRELYPEKTWYKSEPDNEKMWSSTKGTVYDISAQYLASIGIEISPETLKYMTRTATGGSGAFVDSAVSGAMLKSQGAELEAREIPFARKFYGENTIQDARARYGKAKEEARIAFEKFSALNRKEDLVSVEKFLNDKSELLALNDYANSLSDVIRYIRDQQDEIKLSDQYTTAEKRLKIKELEKEEKSYYDMFMKQYKTVKH